MKNLICLVIAFSLFSVRLFAQQHEVAKLPRSEKDSTQIEFYDTVRVPGVAKDELFKRAVKFLTTNFKQKVLDRQIISAGRIEGSADLDVSSGREVFYSITILVSDSFYKYSFHPISYIRESYSEMEVIKNLTANGSPELTDKEWIKASNKILVTITGLVEKLKMAMSSTE